MAEPPIKRRRPIVGYIIAGILGWMLLVAVLIFRSPAFLDDGETPGQTLLFLVLGFLLGGSLYHFLWGKRIRFGLRTLLAAVSVAALLCALGLYWEYLPGTFHFDENGFLHGTGTRLYYYDSGELMGEEHYRAGVLTRTTWYKPNGEVIATTNWKKDQVNIGYFLYQDGSIRTKMEFVYDPEVRLYVADETCDRIDYAPDGTIEREFRDGKEVTINWRGAVESREKATAVPANGHSTTTRAGSVGIATSLPMGARREYPPDPRRGSIPPFAHSKVLKAPGFARTTARLALVDPPVANRFNAKFTHEKAGRTFLLCS